MRGVCVTRAFAFTKKYSLSSKAATPTTPFHTNNYRANTAWQKLNIIANNLMTSMQLTTTAIPKCRSKKRTRSFLLRSIRTIRFEWLTQAARLTRTNGIRSLRLVDTPKIRETYEAISHCLAKAA